MRKPLGKIKNATRAKEMRRKLSLRKKIIGTTDRPRVAVTKTNKNLFVQVIDDSSSKTLFSVQTFGKNGVEGGANASGAKNVGKLIGEKLNQSKVSTVVFDRGGKQYTGVVATLADAIREAGVKF